jgi:glycosyltransferase involved in cell wall biosynthesis
VRIVVFAYACEPREGSEPGAGWAFVRMIAGLGETWVLTRANNRPAIESGLLGLPEADHLHFVYVDLPEWARFWKRGRVGLHPYYLAWQVAALRSARRLDQRLGFDLAWHVTLGNIYLGSGAAYLPVPLILGPVGGAVGPPLRMTPVMGIKGSVYEGVRTAVRGVFRVFNPMAHKAWKRADLILTLNREGAEWLPRRYSRKAAVFHHVALEPFLRADQAPRSPTRRMLYAGRLIPWKGLALAIRALVYLPDWTLLICGEGRDEPRLRRVARRWAVEDRVRFLGVLPRDEVRSLMRSGADVFAFPSLRDDSPWAVGEAIAAGLPVVCLDRGGARAMVGEAVPVSGPRATIRGFARAVEEAPTRPVTDPSSVGFEARRLALFELLEAHGIKADGQRHAARDEVG